MILRTFFDVYDVTVSMNLNNEDMADILATNTKTHKMPTMTKFYKQSSYTFEAKILAKHSIYTVHIANEMNNSP